MECKIVADAFGCCRCYTCTHRIAIEALKKHALVDKNQCHHMACFDEDVSNKNVFVRHQNVPHSALLSFVFVLILCRAITCHRHILLNINL